MFLFPARADYRSTESKSKPRASYKSTQPCYRPPSGSTASAPPSGAHCLFQCKQRVLHAVSVWGAGPGLEKVCGRSIVRSSTRRCSYGDPVPWPVYILRAPMKSKDQLAVATVLWTTANAPLGYQHVKPSFFFFSEIELVLPPSLPNSEWHQLEFEVHSASDQGKLGTTFSAVIRQF